MPKVKKIHVVNKQEELTFNAQFISLHAVANRALKALTRHAAYEELCKDISNILNLTAPRVEAILGNTTAMVPSEETLFEGDLENGEGEGN